jgi:hypothetical protein
MYMEALVAANDFVIVHGKEGKSLKMSQTIYDMEAYSKLSDYLLRTIACSTHPNLDKARAIILRIMRRDIYSFVGEHLLPAFDSYDASSSSEVSFNSSASGITAIINGAPTVEKGRPQSTKEKAKPSKGKKRSPLIGRLPTVQLVDARALDPHRVRYDSAGNKILLNKGANDFATVLSALGTPKRQKEFKDRIRVKLLAAWMSFCNQLERVPNEEEIDALYTAVVVSEA